MRLIDAEILFEKVCNIKPKNKSEYELLGKFMNMITCSTTVKQRPHGKWMREIIVEEPRKNKRAYARCTECGAQFNHYKFAVLHFDFCPKCGADMRPKEGEKYV